MLKDEKVVVFKEYLKKKNGSYSDEMKDEIYIYFFENGNSLDFIENLYLESEIIKKTDSYIHKMIMHEDEDDLCNIIELYT